MRKHASAYRADGTKVLTGETIKDFRGDPAVFQAAEAPRHPGSSGRVYVTLPDASPDPLHWAGYYPSVFNLTVREDA